MSTQKPLFSKKEIPEAAKPVQTAQLFFMWSLALSMGYLLISDKKIDDLYIFIIPFSFYHSWQVVKTGYALANNDVFQRNQNPIAYWVHLTFTVSLSLVLTWLAFFNK